MQKQDEHELIAQSLSENHEAYAELINRYKNALYRHCFAIVRNEDTAEDIAQDSFITAYYKLAQYNPQYRFSTWLFKIATNKALNWLKRAGREIAVDDSVIARVASTLPLPNQIVEQHELHEAVKRLQPRYRAVISLYYWQGLSYQEIAAVLEAPSGSIKGWMSRAKAELRKDIS
ncbi:MAG TPA: sigma-70 family RNA polymerase sigma factor [Candidatus Polarisedimenticolaceae bacterium]|nr:sigma-70 family RNA polymerase sigma factor [Candidatus Polarisedimenticolaceae bacterium]